MTKPMTVNRLEYLETRLSVQAELCHDAQEACQWIRRLRWENGLLDGEKKRLLKKLRGHEALMWKALDKLGDTNAENLCDNIRARLEKP